MRAVISEEASGVVLVHNHPAGRCQPSEMDDKTTRRVQLQCNFINVVLCDHFIYSPEGIYSYYESGKLKQMSKEALQDVNK